MEFPRNGTRFVKTALGDLKTSKGGGRVATSVGDTLTGRGADSIIIDDPMKADDAHSESAWRQVTDWYPNSLVTRLNDQRTGRIVLVMQRLHEEDLVGYRQETGDDWDHLNLPAIATRHETIPLPEGRTHLRKEGDILHPGRETP